MSFAVWQTKPPFPEESLTGEKIFIRVSGVWKHISEVGIKETPDLWVITDAASVDISKIEDNSIKTTAPVAISAREKLNTFLAANPDIIAELGYTKHL